jgi:protein-tyrosine-phosphatase
LKSVLFLCTGNSARSIMAEVMLNHLGRGRFHAFSAGSRPTGMVNPFSLEALAEMGIDARDVRSKSWDEFAGTTAEPIDLVITVCDNAAGEPCPIWPGHPLTAHWGVDDPAAAQGNDEAKRAAFRLAAQALRRRVERLLEIPVERLDACAIARRAAGDRPIMSATAIPAPAALGFFERYLSAWVALAIVAGVLLGQAFPPLFKSIGKLEIARVNVAVGLLIWVMVIPMLVRIDFAALHRVARHVRGIGVTLIVNWLVKPFSMAFLAWVFLRHAFASWLPAGQVDSYVAGLIILAAAPCTAMVFVWSRLTAATLLHPHAGRAERPHHGLRLRAHRRAAPGDRTHHRAMGNAGRLGRALYRDPGARRAGPAAAHPPPRPLRRSKRRSRSSSPGRPRRSSRRWSFSSPSRARQ